MNKFIGLLQRFRHDESGAFAMIFGVMAVVLIALSGAVVDYVSVEQARARAQTALDAAILSLQPSIYTAVAPGYTNKTDEITKKAKALIEQQIANSDVKAVVQGVAYNTTEGTLHIEVSMTVPMRFVALVGFNEMKPLIIAEATRKRLYVEVAMVLDNSGSMDSEDRMDNLKVAAKSATNILFDGEATSSTTFIGVVPFNFWVNVGAGNKNALWLDQAGTSSVSRDNFDDDDDDSTPFAGPVDRFALYDQISDVSWKGCVEARPQPYDADDTQPDVSVPDTLFVPQFAPDEPSGGYYQNSYASDSPSACTYACTYYQKNTNCSYDNPNNCWSTSSSYSGTKPNGDFAPGPSACSCSGETILTDTGWTRISGSHYKFERTRTCNSTSTSGLSEIEKMERICKYTGLTTGGVSNSSGPNADCISTPILPLTNVRQTIDDRIDLMSSNGGTNIHQGAVWGFHMLSPTEPLTEGRAYDAATYKVAIIMTDGENTFYQYSGSTYNLTGGTYYMAYGFPINERLGNKSKSISQMQTLMDNRLLQTCTNMKAAGIDVYTIGLKPPNNSTKDLLKACASEVSKAYFPAKPSDLQSVFEAIAQQLADLRLAE